MYLSTVQKPSSNETDLEGTRSTLFYFFFGEDAKPTWCIEIENQGRYWRRRSAGERRRRAAGGEITVADCKRGWDRERGERRAERKERYTLQREGEKGDKINERREKNNNKLIFSYNILVRTKCFGT